MVSMGKYRTSQIERSKHRRKELRAWLIEYKKKQRCAKCGDTRWYVLDFHHKGKDKEAEIADLVARAVKKETIIAEINKCEVLCSNCHREEHYFAQVAHLVERRLKSRR